MPNLERHIREVAGRILEGPTAPFAASELLWQIEKAHESVRGKLKAVHKNLKLRLCAQCGHLHYPERNCFECDYDRTAVEPTES